MGRRILNEALSTIVNAEKRGFATAQLQPISNVMASFLTIMKHRGYIKDFQVHDPQRVGKITVELQGRINGCRALMYRQDIKAQDIEKYRFHKLPTHQGRRSQWRGKKKKEEKQRQRSTETKGEEEERNRSSETYLGCRSSASGDRLLLTIMFLGFPIDSLISSTRDLGFSLRSVGIHRDYYAKRSFGS